MLKTNSISLAAALALAGSLTLVGCGSSNNDSSADVVNAAAGDTTQTSQAKQTGSITGSVKFINNPTDRTIKTNATTQIVAYNLDDNTKYTTTSTSQGEYDLSGLTEGNYQVIATSTSTTMRSIRQTSVQRDTRSVVDIVLQATGTIKGKLTNYDTYFDMVYIPGTSYISTVDKDGNFELINVPAGDVTIAPLWDDYYDDSFSRTQNVTVVGGEVTVVDDLGFSDVGSQYINYIPSLQTGSTLEMRHEGIRVSLRNSYTLTEFEKLVSLVDSNGTDVAVNVVPEYGYYTNDSQEQYYDSFKVSTSSVVDAGAYTLKLAFGEPYTKEITLADKVAVYGESKTEGGVYNKYLGVAFSNPVADLNSSDITISYLDDQNNTQSLPITKIEKDSGENEYKIIANVTSGVTYKVTLDANISEDDLFYVNNDGNDWYSDGITLGDARVDYVSIDENEQNVPLDKNIRFNVSSSDSLDLQTLKVMLGDKELTLKNGGLKSNDSYGWNRDYLEINIDNSSLVYAKDINMTITANDSYGDKALDKTVSFTTITPAAVGVLPFVTSNDDEDYYDWGNILNNSYEGVLRAYFNVPVDYASGHITLHDNTNNKDIHVDSNRATSNQIYANNTNTNYSIGGFPEELLPNTEYTMTVSGYTAEDGTAIPEKTNTFKTPSRRVINNTVNNGQLLNADNLQNRVEFTTFGKLTDAEKKSFADGLDITSFKTALATDKSHPTPLKVWDDNSPYGSTLIVAFTIEKGTSYELKFTGDVAQELEMTASPLTFMTMGDNVATTGDVPSFNIVNNLYTYGNNQDSNLSKVATSVSGQASVTIPYIVDDNYDSNSWQKCNDLKYKNIYNYSGYDKTPDLNASLITEWMSGDELNVTSTSLSGSDYNSHYSNNSNYYSCDVTYNANFTMANDANSSVSVNVPASALVASDTVADGFVAKDTNRTMVVPDMNEAYANVNIYSNGFNIQFSQPVSVDSLQNLVINTNPKDLNLKINDSYAPYYDADGNKYTTSVYGSLDSSAYSVFAYDINSTLKYYNVQKQSQEDLNMTESGVVYTQADLTPLEVTAVKGGQNVIQIDVNRNVDTKSVLSLDDNGTVISSAFTLTNENNDSNETATVSGAYNKYDYYNNTSSNALVLKVTRSDDNGSNCYDDMNVTLTQDTFIKADNSTQTLDSGSVTAKTITLLGDTSGCN